MARATRVSLIFQVSCFRLIHFNLALLYSSWYRLMCSNSVFALVKLLLLLVASDVSSGMLDWVLSPSLGIRLILSLCT